MTWSYTSQLPGEALKMSACGWGERRREGRVGRV